MVVTTVESRFRGPRSKWSHLGKDWRGLLRSCGVVEASHYRRALLPFLYTAERKRRASALQAVRHDYVVRLPILILVA